MGHSDIIIMLYTFLGGFLIFNKTGHVTDILYVAGLAWSPVYLLATEEPVLFEAGFHCAGRLYADDIMGIVGGRRPKMLFLTHVHWDHCGAAAYLKKVFPELKVAASKRSADIIKRPNALALMRRLSKDVIPLAARLDGVDGGKLIRDPFESFEIDIILKDGQVFDIGNGLSVHVFATPGHTRDMLSYYIPEMRILVATEAAGVLDQSNQVITEFLVDYDMYMASLKRLAALDVDILCQGHHFVFAGDDVKRFFDRSLEAAEKFQRDAQELLEAEGGSIDRVVQLIKARQYDTNTGVKQSEQAYLLNLTTRVTHLANRHVIREPRDEG
jgi:glyoxylase-like metal-dependent hydrolase (beta-lactamase superfamily II)